MRGFLVFENDDGEKIADINFDQCVEGFFSEMRLQDIEKLLDALLIGPARGLLRAYCRKLQAERSNGRLDLPCNPVSDWCPPDPDSADWMASIEKKYHDGFIGG